MSAKNWQAPIHFDLDTLLGNNTTNPRPAPAKKAKSAPEVAKVTKKTVPEKSEKTVTKTALKKAAKAEQLEKPAPATKAVLATAQMQAIPSFENKIVAQVKVSYQKALEIPLEYLAETAAKPSKPSKSPRRPIRFDSQTVLQPASAMAKSTAKRAKSLSQSTWQQSRQMLDKLQAEDFPVWRWLFFSFLSFIILVSVVDAVVFIDTWLNQSLLIGGVFSLMLISIFALTIRLSYKLWQDITRLRVLSTWQQRGKSYQSAQSYGHALAHVTHISQLYQQREDMQSNLESFYRTVNSSHTDAEVCQLYSQQVLSPLDEQAYQMVCRHAGQTALLVTLSPMPLLSGILTLWRNLTLIRDIASLYGGRPSFLTSGRLFISVIHSILYADVSEMVADSMTEIVGGGVFAVFSAQIAQGIGSSMMTGRVGIQAMKLCRPLNFEEEQRPRLAHVRKQTVSLLKQQFKQPSST